MADSANFFDLDTNYSSLQDSAVVIVGVPYDETSTWVKGADKGPSAILEASTQVELYDIETDSEVYRRGIYTDDFVIEKRSPEQMVQAVRTRVAEHVAGGKFTVLAGGEHSVSIGAVEAHAAACQNMSVLQLDAHADLRQSYDESIYNHACVMSRVAELCPFVQVGIRSLDASEREFMDPGRTFFAHEIYDNTAWMQKAIDKLSENVYLTVDLDVFDPSIMPSTGTPEPGGLGWYQVLIFLRKVFTERCVVGFDVVELCPNDRNKAPDFLAAKLIYKLLSYKFGKTSDG